MKNRWPTTSRQSRGYGLLWQKLRLIVLARDHGLCQCVQCQGGKLRLTPATEVHHIKPKAKGGTDALDNLQAIAHECHKRETILERGGTPKPKIGIDGYPVQDPGVDHGAG